MIPVSFEPPPVYFMHVPKSGGVSLGKWLRSAYAGGYFDLDLRQIINLTDRNVRGFRCYHDWHHGRSLFDWLNRPDLTVITMLRNPVERAISNFYYQQRYFVAHPEGFKVEYRAKLSRLSDMELSQCLDDQFLTPVLSNAESRHLGDRRDYGVFLVAVKQYAPTARSHALQRPHDIPQLVNVEDIPLLQSNACTWLDEMAVVGLTERYAESALMIGDLLGIPVPADLPRANVNPRRTDPAMRYQDQLAPEVVARLEELNCYDLELYSYAQELFKQQWARYQARPKRAYSIAAHIRPQFQPIKEAVKRVIRWRPQQYREAA